MGKALVIKNTDFSANAVTTITFDEVPCTGVAFDSATITLDSLGTASIGYTLTPNNTTDAVTISSSDSSVVSVSGTTITAVGIGTSTLTLSCGSYLATCAVTVSITESPIYISGYASVASAANTGKEYDSVRVDGSSISRLFCVGTFADGFFSEELPYDNPFVSVDAVTAIKIPNNATAIHIEATNIYTSGGGGSLKFLDADQSYTYNANTFLPILSSVDLTVSSGSISENVTIPSGATGYILQIRPRSSSEYDSITTEAALKTYAEETCDIAITYA